MDEELSFTEFFNIKLKQKGYSLRKLSDVSGIAIKHLEHLSQGELDRLPPAPYLHGYVSELGRILDFDTQFWWEKLKDETLPASSGRADALPENRFARSPRRRGAVIAAVIVVVVLAYVGFRLPKILGKPEITMTVPVENGITVSQEDFTLEGRVENADQVYVNEEEVQVDEEGAWQKRVLLQRGQNSFEVRAKKFLGRESAIVRQIFYIPPAPSPEPEQEEGENSTSTIEEDTL